MKILQHLIIALILCSAVACNAKTKNDAPLAATELEHTTPVKKHYIKVALLLDTSNSMDGLIDQAKAQLWEIVNELSYAKCKQERPNLEIALYEYGNDGLSEENGYLRKIISFTDDLDTVSKELFSLNTNGGSEYCGTVIQASLNELDWGNDADDLKMVFIAGNEPFTQGKVDYKDAAADAKEKDIVVNTIFCGEFKHGVDTRWKDGADRTYGDYMAINHNKSTVHIASPYDDMILQLNIQLNGTYIPYGSQGRKKRQLQEEQDGNAEDYSKANAVSRTVSKSSHLYKNTSWDLVDAESESGFSYDDLKEKDLPENLQGKSKSEIKTFIAKHRAERKRIQDEIANLNKKRRAYIAKQKNETNNGLESAMIDALKKQAKRKNYTWN